MMKLVASILILTMAVCLASIGRGQEVPSDKASIWMRQKLRASQEILKDLASADFQAIGANAQAMNVMEHLEKWARAQRPGYQTQLRLFEFANRELIRASSQKNLDAATLAYTQLVASCVNCHKLVRDVR